MLVWCLLLVCVTPILGTSIATVPGRPSKVGVVIGKRYLLFAPATFDGRTLEYVKLRVGSLNNHNGGLEFDMKAYVAHPFYDPRTDDKKGRTGKENRDNIALVVVTEDLPIGQDNVDKADLADANFATEGPAYVLRIERPYNRDVSRISITILSKADCESIYNSYIDCTRNLLAETPTCDVNIGAPVFSGNILIGTIASTEWCRYDRSHVFVNSMPYYEKWIKRAINDEETQFSKT